MEDYSVEILGLVLERSLTLAKSSLYCIVSWKLARCACTGVFVQHHTTILYLTTMESTVGRIAFMVSCSLGIYMVDRYMDTGVGNRLWTMFMAQDNENRLGRRCYSWQVASNTTGARLLGVGSQLGWCWYPQKVAWMPSESPFACACHIMCWWLLLLDDARICYLHDSYTYSCLHA